MKAGATISTGTANWIPESLTENTHGRRSSARFLRFGTHSHAGRSDAGRYMPATPLRGTLVQQAFFANNLSETDRECARAALSLKSERAQS
ncbi:hypothetical protein AA0522_1236 [Gluconacetobacter liquefaciens NRIC 0522]|nr:hypothetical protein AA0522_1236 [Gluconacetobacter liquefaciens NRIC 0522]